MTQDSLIDRGRKGTSLVEMVVVIAIMTVVFAMTTVMFHSMFETEGQVQAEVDADRMSAWLERRLREDAHLAQAAVFFDNVADDQVAPPNGAEWDRVPSDGLRLEMGDDSKVEYRITTAALHRNKLSGDKVVHRDQIQFPENSTARWQVNRAGSRTLVSLTVEYPVHADSNATRELRIETVVGLTHSIQRTANDVAE